MGDFVKSPFIFSMLLATLLTGCGSSGDFSPDNPELTINPTSITAPPVGDVTKVSECGTLPGQWAFSDLTSGTPVSIPTYKQTAIQSAYRKSWGGTTTAYAIIKQISGSIPVWNEGRKLHIGDSASLTTADMIRSISVTGSSSKPVVLIGTDGGLVIVDLNYDGKNFSISSQKTVTAVTRVRSIDTATNLIMNAGDAPTEMVYMVSDDSVLLVKLSDLRTDSGCMYVAYQAKDHPVDPSNPKDKRFFRPIKVVAENTLGAFLTAARLPEEFATADQLKLALQKEWLSFQSTAYLIDIARQKPVTPFIMQMGVFDRFFASDIGMTSTSIFLFGTRYQTIAPGVLASGIAIFNSPIGTPVANLWSEIPANFGDFRMGRMDTFISSAYIRGLDSLARVDAFYTGPTNEKWTVWPSKLPFDYVRGSSFRAGIGVKNEGVQETVTVPQFLPTGPTTAVWEYKNYPNNLGAPQSVPYTPLTRILEATDTTVHFHDSANGVVISQRASDAGFASFPVIQIAGGADTASNANTPRMFQTGGLLFYVRHGNNGPRIRVFPDTITGNIDIGDKGPASTGFRMDFNPAKGGSFDLNAVGAFGGMQTTLESTRVDDIRVFRNPALPTLYHIAALVHAWDGIANRYRVMILQMDLAPLDIKKRTVTIQGCSDIVDPSNNYSWNTNYGKLDDQARFLGSFRAVQLPNGGGVIVKGYFQHNNPVHNVWSLNMVVGPNVIPELNPCAPTGEITPLPQADISAGVSAAAFGNTFINLHSNGILRWIESATTTRILDVGSNILGGAVSAPTGEVVQAGTHYLVKLDNTDGFHPTALLDLNGSFGENCPDCQFTDLASTGNIVYTAHPERGIELYDFQ